MDYNDYAAKYRINRFAVNWILEPLIEEIKKLAVGSNILEIGCGTGNYVIACSEKFPNFNYVGFDLSDKMIDEAIKRNSSVKFTIGNCESEFPFETGSIDFAFCVDVVHHLLSLDNFYSECSRISKNNSPLHIVTDTEENLKRRSLTKFFPEIMKIELDRCPDIEVLKSLAKAHNYVFSGIELAEGEIDLETYAENLEAKNSSAMRLMNDQAHKKGMERVREAAKRGEKWLSSYSIVKFYKA